MTTSTYEDRDLLTALRLACEWFETSDPTPAQLQAVRSSATFALLRLAEEGRRLLASLPGRRLLDAALDRYAARRSRV